ncbi:DUF3102 domain-containing protein [Rhizobium sp. 18065]|uniref:DUF3102 domain-containing protein n=1 Tax=Rhizobium sp. 18065 TaxID=2681411 RepID=UPI001356D082|nr:DUF3102 domain-containing protein [Rhizobium sp. 18065]
MTSYDLQDLALNDFDLSGNNPVIEMEIALAPIEPAPKADEATEPRDTLETRFDYSGVSEAVAAEAEEAARKIRDRLRGSIIDTGSDLIAIKEKLRHGKFGAWLTFHFNMSERTAQNFMNAAAAFADTPKVVDLLPPATVYKLAAKGAPLEVRQSVVNQIAAGATPSQKEIEARLASAKGEERKKRDQVRAEQEEAKAWSARERELQAAGRSDEDITAERNRWNAKKARKDRKREKLADEEKTRAQRSQRAAEELMQRQQEMETFATKAATILKKRLADKFDEFREIILKVDFEKFKQAMQNA